MFLLITGAVLTGTVLGSYLFVLPLTVLGCLVCAAVGLSIVEAWGRLTATHGVGVYGALLGGVVLWVLAEREASPAPPTAPDIQEPMWVTGTVVESPSYAPNRVGLVLEVTQAHTDAGYPLRGHRIRVTWREPDQTFLPGDEVRVLARIHPPIGTRNPGGFDYGAYLRQQGFVAVASLTGPGRIALVSVPPRWSRWTPWRLVERWRDHIRRAAVTTLADPARGIFLGIIIGEQGYLGDELRDTFMATGTVHLLSISGSHLGLVALLTFTVVKGVCRMLPPLWLLSLSRLITPTRLAAVATLVLVAFYTMLAGAEVATVRSFVMTAIVMLAVWLGRGHDLLRAVACAALLLVLENPRTIYDIAFQLSFVAVAAIALVIGYNEPTEGLPPRERTFWGAARAKLVDYVKLTGSISLATLPLVAYHFKQIAWLGLVVNAIVVPLAGALLVPMGLASAVWLLASGADTLPLATVNQALLDFFAAVVAWCAQIPGAEWHVASPSVPAMGVFYLLLILAIRPGTDGPSWWSRASCLVGALALVAWWAWSPRMPVDPDTVRVTFLDVGQGDACVIELPDGETVLIDGGARYESLDMGRAVVGPYLWERGIRHLDHVIATHPQLDHIGGLAWVLRTFTVGQYWSNGVTREEVFDRRLREMLKARGLIEARAEEGREIIGNGSCQLVVLNPPLGSGQGKPERRSASAPSGRTLNNLSVVTRLTCGPHTFAFTADVEADALARLYQRGLLSGATVVKIPHHGAASSLYKPWITHAGAKIAVLSVGRHNAYGHPAPRVIEAYEAAGMAVLRTDRDGAIWITARLSRPELRIDTMEDFALRPVPLTANLIAEEWHNWRRIWR